jgi:hypothetical protein
MAVTYERPPVDNVASDYYVDVPEEINGATQQIETVTQGIAVYLPAYRHKFHSRTGRKQRQTSLLSFERYLVAQGHSLKLKDLTLVDGQDFLDSLTNHNNGLPLRFAQKKKYRSALRSFSRFLHELGAIEENIFLAVTRE